MRTLSKKSSTQWTPPAVMTAEDYRCAFDIVSDCHDSSTLNEFREALVESLCRHLSIPNVSFFSGATFNQVFEDESPLTEGATRKMHRNIRTAGPATMCSGHRPLSGNCWQARSVRSMN